MVKQFLFKVRFLVVFSLFTGLVYWALQGEPVQSNKFLSPIPPTPSCDAGDQVMCSEGGTKSFGPFNISFPNGFYMSKVRAYCDIKGASEVPSYPAALRPVSNAIFCGFSEGDTQKPLYGFLRPIQITMAIPKSQTSYVALYQYQSSGWTRLSRIVPASEGIVIFSLEQLNPAGSEGLNYFLLFEAQASTPTAQIALTPTRTPTVSPARKPTLVPTKVVNPTFTVQLINTSIPTPVSTDIARPTTAATETPVPAVLSVGDTSSSMDQPAEGGGSGICGASLVPVLGMVGISFVVRKRKSS